MTDSTVLCILNWIVQDLLIYITAALLMYTANYLPIGRYVSLLKQKLGISKIVSIIVCQSSMLPDTLASLLYWALLLLQVVSLLGRLFYVICQAELSPLTVVCLCPVANLLCSILLHLRTLDISKHVCRSKITFLGLIKCSSVSFE